MANKRKERTIAGFGSVASEDFKNANENNNNDNNNEFMNDILKKTQPKDKTHTQRGFYLENEVSRTLDRITTGKSKGIKSELVNEILKRYFKQNGYM